MANLIELKIKRKTLAAEGSMIRLEETKALKRARLLLVLSHCNTNGELRGRLSKLGYNQAQRDRIVASAAKKRNDIQPTPAYHVYENLRGHRTGIVRDAARSAHLANAFLRGKEYKTVEQSHRQNNPPNVAAITSNIRKFGNLEHNETSADKMKKIVSDWVEGNYAFPKAIAA